MSLKYWLLLCLPPFSSQWSLFSSITVLSHPRTTHHGTPCYVTGLEIQRRSYSQFSVPSTAFSCSVALPADLPFHVLRGLIWYLSRLAHVWACWPFLTVCQLFCALTVPVGLAFALVFVCSVVFSSSAFLARPPFTPGYPLPISTMRSCVCLLSPLPFPVSVSHLFLISVIFRSDSRSARLFSSAL